MLSVEQVIGGWGNRPVERCFVSRSDSVVRLQEQIASANGTDYIPRGMGRAYGDSSLNRERGVLDQTLLNRILGFDPQTGVVTCEAGVTLEDLIQTFLPRGWFLPVTPGTKYVTVGGAIAADVHGKNHHCDGTFGRFVEALELVIGDGSRVTCSPTERPELFWATVGGMGLTGVIVTARFRMRKVETSYYEVTFRRNKDLDATLECLRDTSGQYRHSVAWMDCLASGANLGRSVLMLANDGTAAALPSRYQADPLRTKVGPRALVPFDFPSFALSPMSVKAFNTVFYTTHTDKVGYEHYEKFWYPLDFVHRWNRIYGSRGFIQYQALLPLESSRTGFMQILERISQAGAASFLAVFKLCGPANPSPLSYLFEGHTLALDIPWTDDLPDLTRELDRILLEHGGRLYLAKDAMMDAATFREMYPRLDEFRAVKAEVDPKGRFSSSQARRVGIVEAP